MLLKFTIAVENITLTLGFLCTGLLKLFEHMNSMDDYYLEHNCNVLEILGEM